MCMIIIWSEGARKIKYPSEVDERFCVSLPGELHTNIGLITRHLLKCELWMVWPHRQSFTKHRSDFGCIHSRTAFIVTAGVKSRPLIFNVSISFLLPIDLSSRILTSMLCDSYPTWLHCRCAASSALYRCCPTTGCRALHIGNFLSAVRLPHPLCPFAASHQSTVDFW